MNIFSPYILPRNFHMYSTLRPTLSQQNQGDCEWVCKNMEALRSWVPYPGIWKGVPHDRTVHKIVKPTDSRTEVLDLYIGRGKHDIDTKLGISGKWETMDCKSAINKRLNWETSQGFPMRIHVVYLESHHHILADVGPGLVTVELSTSSSSPSAIWRISNWQLRHIPLTWSLHSSCAWGIFCWMNCMQYRSTMRGYLQMGVGMDVSRSVMCGANLGTCFLYCTLASVLDTVGYRA